MAEKYRNEIEVLGAFVHGVLSGFHSLGIIYNVKRKNRYDTTIHAVALTYDLYSAWNHYKKIKGLEAIL